MRRFLQYCSLAAAVALIGPKVAGFSLLGPSPTWQTTGIGYIDFANLPNHVSGGAMNLGEGYRWNIPTLYYTFTPDFLHYFGTKGAAEVEKAIAILNALPSMDNVNLASIPLQSQRANFRATALGLYDLKSIALSRLVEDLGVADPTRFVFTLRSRFVVGQTTNYFVIQRNFDPVTFEPTSFINGQLWTYTSIIDPINPNLAEPLVFTEPVDPLALGGLINAPVSSANANSYLLVGGFWTGLTRDDVGALRYLYRSGNVNTETAVTNATRAGPGVSASLGSGGSTDSSWVPVDQVLFPPGTTVGTGTGTGAGTGTPTTQTNFVVTGLRPGVAKLQFVRVNYDSLVGQFPSNTVSFTDRVLTNGSTISQSLVRPLTTADIIFDAQDIVGSDTANGWFITSAGLATAFQNNDALNGLTGTDGPGQLQPSLAIVFNKAGRALANNTPAFISEVNSSPLWNWGSFDGSTNAPVVYPSGASIAELEQQVLSGGGGGGGGISGGGASLTSPWSAGDQILFPPGTTITGATGGGAATGTGTTP